MWHRPGGGKVRGSCWDKRLLNLSLDSQKLCGFVRWEGVVRHLNSLARNKNQGPMVWRVCLHASAPFWYVENITIKNASYAQEFADQTHPAGGNEVLSQLGGFGRNLGGAGAAVSDNDWSRSDIVSAADGGTFIPRSDMLVSLSGSNADKIGPVSMP